MRAWIPLPLALVAILAGACHKKMPTGIELPRALALPAFVEEASALPPAEALVSEDAPDPSAPLLTDALVSEPPPEDVPGQTAECPGGASPPRAKEDRPPVKLAEVRPPAKAPEEPPRGLSDAGPDLKAIPRLLPEAAAPWSAGAAYEALARAERLLPVLRVRDLDSMQRKERDAGATFIVQAREALAASDADRAAVLAEKAVALIEHLEFATRR